MQISSKTNSFQNFHKLIQVSKVLNHHVQTLSYHSIKLFRSTNNHLICFGIFLFLVLGLSVISQAQVIVSLDYQEKNNLTTVKAGELYTLQLNYSVSSTTGNATGVKAIINLPDNIGDVRNFVGNADAPVSNFVFDNTLGSKTLTITFISPLSSGSTGVLEFSVLTNNLTTPNNTVLPTTAELTANGGYTSGVKNQSIIVTATPHLCAEKLLAGGGALDGVTTYRIKISYTGDNTYGHVDVGTLEATNLVLTDVLPAGTQFISGQVFDGQWNSWISNVTYNAGTITAIIPDLSVSDFNGSNWSSRRFYVDIAVKYNSPTFSVGSVVTNNASIAFVPYGSSATTLVNGQTLGGTCVTDLIETTTIVEPIASANLTKSAFVTDVYGLGQFVYGIGYVNTGNVALNNVEIIETIPSNIRLDQSRSNGLSIQDIGNIDHLEYQTFLNSGWTVMPYQNVTLPIAAAGDYYTKIKIVLKSPLNPNDGLSGYNNRIYFVPTNTVTVDETVSNCLNWTSTTSGISGSTSVCNTQVTLHPTPNYAKLIYSTYNSRCGTVNIGDVVTFKGRLSTELGYASVVNPVCAFFLPSGFDYNVGSTLFEPNTSGITNNPTLQIVKNYITIGGVMRDMYRFTFPSGTILPDGKSFDISIQATVSNRLLANNNYTIEFVASGDNPINISSTWASGYDFTDTNDWDLDGNTTEIVGLTQEAFGCRTTIAATTSMQSVKWVKGQLDTNYSRYPAFGQTVRGGSADYKLVVRNAGNVPMKDIKIIDILPFVGDNGVIDTSPRLTEWRPNLAAPISAPAGITVYYSTVSNPCRDEMKAVTDPSPFPTGCTPPNWNIVPPSDITKVQSIKIDFGVTILAGGDSLVFNWPMRAPNNAPVNSEIAWNSFGFVATRTDNNQSLLAAEPIKVGIQVHAPTPAFYGDRVWFDTNKNGIQDVGEGGVDGVTVKLFSPKGSVANPAIDSLVNFTITGNGGLYLFSNLNVGNYYAVFCLPNQYQISPAQVGSDNTIDSDGTPTTYNGGLATITPITSLTINETDLSWDQGIYCSFTPSITSNSPVTVGGTLNLSASGGTIYSWSGPNGFNATGATVNISNIALKDSGEYIVNISDASGCYASLKTNVIVNTCAKPTVTLTPQIQAMCLGQAASTFSAVVTGINTNRQWYGPLSDTISTFGIGIVGATNLTYTPNLSQLPLAGQTKYFAVIIQNGGVSCADTAFVALTVNSKPNAGLDQHICSPLTTASLSGTPSGGIWTIQSGNPVSASVSNMGEVTGMTLDGIYSFIYTVNGCADTVSVIRIGQPIAGTVTVTQAICNGSQVVSNAKIDVVGIVNGNKYSYGTTTANFDYSTATSLTGSEINLTGLSNPPSDLTYYIRIYNGSGNCSIDIPPVLLKAIICNTPCGLPNCLGIQIKKN